jgi:hypothetical protein
MDEKSLENLTKVISKIYHETGRDAELYLFKARKLQKLFGSGFAISYCWFYSVPQRWTQVEPKILRFAEETEYFDLDTILSRPLRELVNILKPMIFRNVIACQFKNFCRVIKDKYSTWDCFADALKEKHIFDLFNQLRTHQSIRLTFKNLSAMKVFVARDDNLIILDRHVARVLGILEYKNLYVQNRKCFEMLLSLANKITKRLERELCDISMAKWSLAIWFKEAKICGNKLLPFVVP